MFPNPALRAAALIAALGFLPAALAAQDHGAHAGHDMTSGSAPPWAMAYDASNAQMHQGMAIAYSENPDLDFARAMLAHHQGAVAMAQIQLEFGTDPEMRALAEAIIAAQGPEIEQMRAFIARHGE